MTQEQMENTMNFIVEQRAKFLVDRQRLKESHEQRMKEIMADQSRLQELMKQLDEAKVKAFKALSKLQKNQKQTAKTMREATAKSNQRLKALLNAVEQPQRQTLKLSNSRSIEKDSYENP